PLHGRKFKAVIPGGASVPIQTMEEADATVMDYEGFVAQGSMLGSGGVIVIDDAQPMVTVIARIARFFAHESCAQCTQCREGTAWTTKILERIRDGEGTTILEAAKTAGILIPHYCYHPGLPVAGLCRMCLVEVEKAAKLAPSCATTVAEGQVVHVYSEKSLDARKGVLEMLLINHPLDCPICDQSGECELQDYTYQEGREDSRYREPKRFNPAEDFGGDVIYVPNRCILCTRCVRFMDDVAHDSSINVSERGDRALIGKFEGKDLTHPWAANVVDLCPVGALLSKDFLNKARAWELDRTASICPNCTQGCNVTMETREN